MSDTKKNEHHDSSQHGHARPSYDDVKSSIIVMVGLISIIVTVFIVAVVQGMAYHWASSVSATQNEKYGSSMSKEFIEAQKKELVGNGSTVSIDQAMKKVIEKFGKPAGEGPNSTPDGTASLEIGHQSK